MLIPIIEEAAREAGGVEKLAEKLGVSRQALHLWKVVPAERVVDFEMATEGRVPRERLRPDLYRTPDPEQQQPAA